MTPRKRCQDVQYLVATIDSREVQTTTVAINVGAPISIGAWLTCGKPGRAFKDIYDSAQKQTKT